MKETELDSSKVAARTRALFAAGRAVQIGAYRGEPPTSPPARWGLRGRLTGGALGGVIAVVAWLVVRERPVAPPAPPPPETASQVEPRPATSLPPLELPGIQPAPRDTRRPAAVRELAFAPVSPSLPDPPEPSTLGEQLRLLSNALHALRVEHDAATALKLLQESDARFPKGELQTEVGLATVEAHRALGAPEDALRALERLTNVPPARQPELTVLRGELLASMKRCSEALPLLELAASAAGTVGERALLGAAGCEEAQGDEARARLWLNRYERTFTAGLLSDQARALRERLDGRSQGE